VPSNALSIKAFDTKAPVICQPPPWPPALPPPPIVQAKFFVFASIRYDHPDYPIQFAASCKLHYTPAYDNWYGTSLTDPAQPYIYTTLASSASFPKYTIEVTYVWPISHSRGRMWFDQQFSTERPYVGQPLEIKAPDPYIRIFAVVREIPS